MSETAIRTWYLADSEISATAEKIDRINRRAVRQGLAGLYTYRTTGQVKRTPVYASDIPAPVEKPLYYTETHEFEVLGNPPKLNGWQFIATLTWDAGVLVTRTAPGFEGQIDESAITPESCDHCHTVRARNDTYLVESESGARKQIGSACVKDFLGHSFSPAWIRSSDLDDIERESGSFGGQPVSTIDAVLAWAASMTDRYGWVSRAKAEETYQTPSSHTLKELLFGNSPAAREARSRLAPTAEHTAEAARVRAWILDGLEGDGEYAANLRRLAGAEYITERNVGLLGSAVAAHHRQVAADVAKAARKQSQHLGQPGGKLELDVTVQSCTPIDGDWGTSYLYLMTDAAGNVAKWFSSRKQSWQLGQAVRIKGTVKGHEVYNEVRQTALTRCKDITPAAELEAAS